MSGQPETHGYLALERFLASATVTSAVVGLIRQRGAAARELWGWRHIPEGHREISKPKAARRAATGVDK